MLKVLIAEDEMLVRIGLKNAIHWDKLGMAVVDDVENGELALASYQKNRPDILLTDLKMPLMNGIELITEIRRQDTDIQIIILTCLEEFSMAQQAVKLGVFDYILKLTMQIEDMERILASVAELIDRSAERRGTVEAGSAVQGDTLEAVLKNQTFYGLYDDESFSLHISRLELSMSPECLSVMVMEINNYNRMQEDLGDEQGRLIALSLRNILEELLTDHHAVFFGDGNRFVFLFDLSADKSRRSVRDGLTETAEAIAHNLYKYFNVRVTFGVSGMASGFQSLQKLYGDAVKALENRSRTDGGTVYFACDNPFLSAEIQRAVDYIESHFSRQITLSDVASLVALSPNYLSSLFKKEMTVSIVDYINRRRVEEVKQLLETTSLRTAEIAGRTGFHDDAYLCRTFKRFEGRSPQSHRRAYRERWAGTEDRES